MIVNSKISGCFEIQFFHFSRQWDYGIVVEACVFIFRFTRNTNHAISASLLSSLLVWSCNLAIVPLCSFSILWRFNLAMNRSHSFAVEGLLDFATGAYLFSSLVILGGTSPRGQIHISFRTSLQTVRLT